MILVTPVFNYMGTCEEAIHLYERAFGTKVDFILRYSDASPEDWKRPLDEKEKTYVYHAEMKIGSQRVMFSDIIEFDIRNGNSLSLAVTFETREEVRKAWAILSEGGDALVPLRSTTYSSCVGTLTDRFGIRWGLMTEQTER